MGSIIIDTPKPYGLFHLVSLVPGIFVLIFFILFKFGIKKQSKTDKNILIIFMIILIVGNIIKQYYHYKFGEEGVVEINEFPWSSLPFQFCDGVVYLLPIYYIIERKNRDNKILNIMAAYIAIYSIIGGTTPLVLPFGLFSDKLILSIETVIHHFSMIYLGIYFWKTRYFSFDELKKSHFIFIIQVFVALSLNYIFVDMSKNELNLMYLRPDVKSRIAVLNLLQPISFVLFWLSYILLFVVTANFLFFVGKKVYKVKEYEKIN